MRCSLIQQRARRAYELKLMGTKLREIASAIGYKNPASAWHAIHRYIASLPTEEERRDARVRIQRQVSSEQKGKTGPKKRTGVTDEAPMAARSLSNYDLWKLGAYRRGK